MKSLSQITKAKIIGAVLFTLILAGSLFLTFANADDTPPEFSFESPGFQGLLKIKNGLKIFQDEDQDNHDDFLDDNDFTSSDSIELTKGAAFYYANEKTSLADIIFGIDPDAEGMIFAFYSPGETINNKAIEKGFHVYPKAPSSTATTKTFTIEKPQDFYVPTGRGFIIYAKKESKAYGFQSSDEKADYTSYSYLADNQSGWVNVAANYKDLDDFLTPVENRVEKIFVQNKVDQIQTQKQKDDDYEFDDYYMVWLRLGVKPGTQPADDNQDGDVTTQPEINVTLTGSAADQKVDLIWETDNKDANISGFRLYKSTIIPIKLVEQNKFKDFDKNTFKYADTGLKNNELYGYKIAALDKDGKVIESSASKDLIFKPSKDAEKKADDKESFQNLDEALTLDLKADSNSIKLTFNKEYNLNNLSKYKIYRSTSGTFTTIPTVTELKELTDIKANSYTDNIASPNYGQNYTYLVIAYDKNGKPIAKSPQKSSFLIKPQIADFEVKELYPDFGTFEWMEVPQATSYVLQVKKSTDPEGEWVKEDNNYIIWKPGNIDQNGTEAKKTNDGLKATIDLKNLEKNTNYDFKLIPIISFLPDQKSAIVIKDEKVADPYVNIVTISPSHNSLKVDWSKPNAGVDGYNVYLYETNQCESEKSTINNISKNIYTYTFNEDLFPETEYFVKVTTKYKNHSYPSACNKKTTLPSPVAESDDKQPTENDGTPEPKEEEKVTLTYENHEFFYLNDEPYLKITAEISDNENIKDFILKINTQEKKIEEKLNKKKVTYQIAVKNLDHKDYYFVIEAKNNSGEIIAKTDQIQIENFYKPNQVKALFYPNTKNFQIIYKPLNQYEIGSGSLSEYKFALSSSSDLKNTDSFTLTKSDISKKQGEKFTSKNVKFSYAYIEGTDSKLIGIRVLNTGTGAIDLRGYDTLKITAINSKNISSQVSNITGKSGNPVWGDDDQKPYGF